MKSIIRHRAVSCLILAIFPGLLIALGMALENAEWFRRGKSHFQNRKIPFSMLRLGQAGKMARYFQVKNLKMLRIESISGELPPEELPSSTILDTNVLKGSLPILSMVVDGEDLYHPNTGIITNPTKRGARWERPTYISYFVDGKLKFASAAGIRIHGGKSRIGSPQKSYRVYFKSIYGATEFAPGILFEGKCDPVETLIIHNDVRTCFRDDRRQNWHFTNPLAYDIAKQMGCLTVRTMPTKLYLNGNYEGPYVLTESVDKNFLVNHFGHGQFIMARSKEDNGESIPLKQGDQDLFETFRKWPDPTPKSGPFLMNKAAEMIDLENFSLWFLSVAYCGTTDTHQGTLILDQSREDARWRLINWDMDQSFMDFYGKASVPWNIDLFDFVLNEPFDKQRSVIFRRLRSEDPEFKEYFKKLFTEVFNHRVKEEFLLERIKYYEDLSIASGIDDRGYIDAIKDFVKHRPEVLREQMKTHFDAGACYPVRVIGSSPISLEINGHSERSGFEGWYFEGMKVEIKVAEGDLGKLASWKVNGVEQPASPSLEFSVNQPIVAEAIRLE